MPTYFQLQLLLPWLERLIANFSISPTQQFVFQPQLGFFFFYRKFFSQSNDGEVLGVFCEIVEGIIIFCLNVFSPHFLQPAESGTQSIFSVLRSWEKNWYSKNHSRSHFFSLNQSVVIGVLSVPKLQYIYCSEVKYIIVKVKKLSSVFIAGLQEQEGAAAA